MIIIDKIKVSLDLDDVLSDFNGHWIQLYNEKSGDILTLNQITDWDLTKFVLSEWRDRIFSEEIIYSPKFFLNVPTRKYAYEFMDWICHNKKYDVSIVSASHFSTVPDKAQWIANNFPFFNIKNFIPCYHKFKIKSDVIIDDGIHNFEGFENVRLFLMDQPWNRKFKDYDHCRYNDLRQVKSTLECMEHNKYWGNSI